MTPTFGFSVACYMGDRPLLRGCLESLRYFAPHIPVCLVVDGKFSTKALERAYDVQVIRRENVKDARLRKMSFGYGFTKLIAMWESPFDIVFHLDADAVLWGDVSKNLPEQPWDVAYNEPHEIITPFIQKTQYFDPERIFKHIEPFAWEGNPYFNAGVICFRRGCLDLDEYLRMVELWQKHPEDFALGEQGIFNILVFRTARAGRLVAKPAPLQTMVPMETRAELERRFRFEGGKPVVEGRPTIIHWAGIKPMRQNRELFSEPMDYFREKSMRRCGLPGVIPTSVAVSADEYLSCRLPKQVLAIKKPIKKLIGRK